MQTNTAVRNEAYTTFFEVNIFKLGFVRDIEAFGHWLDSVPGSRNFVRRFYFAKAFKTSDTTDLLAGIEIHRSVKEACTAAMKLIASCSSAAEISLDVICEHCFEGWFSLVPWGSGQQGTIRGCSANEFLYQDGFEGLPGLLELKKLRKLTVNVLISTQINQARTECAQMLQTLQNVQQYLDGEYQKRYARPLEVEVVEV